MEREVGITKDPKPHFWRERVRGWERYSLRAEAQADLMSFLFQRKAQWSGNLRQEKTRRWCQRKLTMQRRLNVSLWMSTPWLRCHQTQPGLLAPPRTILPAAPWSHISSCHSTPWLFSKTCPPEKFPSSPSMRQHDTLCLPNPTLIPQLPVLAYLSLRWE